MLKRAFSQMPTKRCALFSAALCSLLIGVTTVGAQRTDSYAHPRYCFTSRNRFSSFGLHLAEFSCVSSTSTLTKCRKKAPFKLSSPRTLRRFARRLAATISLMIFRSESPFSRLRITTSFEKLLRRLPVSPLASAARKHGLLRMCRDLVLKEKNDGSSCRSLLSLVRY